MTNSPSNGALIDAGPDELGRREVPEIVKTDFAQPERVTNPGEETGDIVGSERLRPIQGVRKDVGILRNERLGLLRPIIDIGPMMPEECDADDIQCHDPELVGLRPLFGHRSRYNDEGPGHVQLTPFEVHISPPEGTQLTPPHSGQRSKHEERSQPGVTILGSLDY